MSKSPISEIWFHETSKTFFSIPSEVQFLPGDFELQRFDGVHKKVQAEALESYKIPAENAEERLTEHYEVAKKSLSKAMSAMTQFSILTNKAGHSDFNNLFDGEPSEGILGKSQQWMKEFMQTMQDENASKEEQQESFKSAFGQVPEMLNFFDEASLKKAAENPEAWAQEMQEKMFGKADAKRKEQKKEQRQNDINEQIRQNIEDAMKKHNKKDSN